MKPSEVADLLTLCATYDQRTIGETDVAAWWDLLKHADWFDARDVVRAWYANHRERIMPSDVMAGCRAVSNERASRLALEQLKHQPEAVPPPPGWREMRERIGQPRPEVDPTRHQAALAVRCPWCGAPPENPCVSKASSAELRSIDAHFSRYDAAGVGSPMPSKAFIAAHRTPLPELPELTDHQEA